MKGLSRRGRDGPWPRLPAVAGRPGILERRRLQAFRDHPVRSRFGLALPPKVVPMIGSRLAILTAFLLILAQAPPVRRET